MITAVVNLDYTTFVEMAFASEILKSTVEKDSVLDIETKAAIFIQRRFRKYLAKVLRKRGEGGYSGYVVHCHSLPSSLSLALASTTV